MSTQGGSKAPGADRAADPPGRPVHIPVAEGTVVNIQKYSLHDGPGFRTTVFMKGCPLRCQWCSNPEGMRPKPQLAYRESMCIGIDPCGRCASVCDDGAISVSATGMAQVDFDRCTHCGKCAEVCPSKALEITGVHMDRDQVMRRVEQDGAFYRRSGGGITLSGGECTAQPEFSASLLEHARSQGLSTAIETSGYAKWEALRSVAELADLVHFDIKHMDSARHREYTGVRNELILENFKKLGALLPPERIIVRTPVVPGFNDTAEDIGAIARFIRTVNEDIVYELLPYHRLGENKYGCLGIPYAAADIDARLDAPESADFQRLVELGRKGRVLVPLTPRQGPPLLPRLRAQKLPGQATKG